MIDFEVINWYEYSKLQNENVSLEAMARAGVIKLRKPEEIKSINTIPAKKKRGRPKGSKNKRTMENQSVA